MASTKEERKLLCLLNIHIISSLSFFFFHFYLKVPLPSRLLYQRRGRRSVYPLPSNFLPQIPVIGLLNERECVSVREREYFFVFREEIWTQNLSFIAVLVETYEHPIPTYSPCSSGTKLPSLHIHGIRYPLKNSVFISLLLDLKCAREHHTLSSFRDVSPAHPASRRSMLMELLRSLISSTTKKSASRSRDPRVSKERRVCCPRRALKSDSEGEK